MQWSRGIGLARPCNMAAEHHQWRASGNVGGSLQRLDATSRRPTRNGRRIERPPAVPFDRRQPLAARPASRRGRRSEVVRRADRFRTVGSGPVDSGESPRRTNFHYNSSRLRTWRVEGSWRFGFELVRGLKMIFLISPVSLGNNIFHKIKLRRKDVEHKTKLTITTPIWVEINLLTKWTLKKFRLLRVSNPHLFAIRGTMLELEVSGFESPNIF